MESLIEVLIWRLTWWLVRLLWLPFLIVAAIYYVVIPALLAVLHLLLSPEGLLAAGLLAVWLWRPRRRSRRE